VPAPLPLPVLFRYAGAFLRCPARPFFLFVPVLAHFTIPLCFRLFVILFLPLFLVLPLGGLFAHRRTRRW